jgi:hypothetical protein
MMDVTVIRLPYYLILAIKKQKIPKNPKKQEKNEFTAFSHFGDPVDENPLLRTLFSVCCNGRTQAFAKFHLARTNIVETIAIVRLRIHDLMTS